MDAEFEKQAERYQIQRFLDIAKARRAARQGVENDLARRGLLRSGMFVGQLLQAWGALLQEHCDALLADWIDLVGRHIGLDDQSAEWLRQRYVGAVEGLGRGLRQELEEATRRIGLRELQTAGQQELEQLTGRVASRGRLRIDTALGEAKLTRTNSKQKDVSADLDEMVPPLLKKAVFERDLQEELEAAAAAAYPLGLVVLDGDNFKKVNDDHGHDVGDEVIKGMGSVISQAVLRRGKGYRFGGDEFALVLPNHSSEECLTFAEGLRGRIEASAFGAKALKLTATLGVACFPDDAADAAALFRAADQALLAAKGRGRNVVARAST
jgi:diguanylate cyclase (GGDEF)-like protein